MSTGKIDTFSMNFSLVLELPQSLTINETVEVSIFMCDYSFNITFGAFGFYPK